MNICGLEFKERPGRMTFSHSSVSIYVFDTPYVTCKYTGFCNLNGKAFLGRYHSDTPKGIVEECLGEIGETVEDIKNAASSLKAAFHKIKSSSKKVREYGVDLGLYDDLDGERTEGIYLHVTTNESNIFIADLELMGYHHFDRILGDSREDLIRLACVQLDKVIVPLEEIQEMAVI